MDSVLDVIKSVNQCQISEMAASGLALDPNAQASCEVFSRHVQNVHAAIRHTYQVVAFLAVREVNPAVAAELWKSMSELCDEALTVLKSLREAYAHFGTPELYDLALDYKLAADKRFQQNLEDAACLKTAPPEQLFPRTS